MSETKVNFFNKLKSTVINKSNSVPDITGHIIGNFSVERKMDIPSGEADIYLCSNINLNSDDKFILKYYRRENAVKQEVIDKLRSVDSPYVAPISDYGEYNGHQYTIRPYYKMPALSDVLTAGTRFSEEELRVFIIPSVIEGLRAIHDADILHRDLKPGNLIPDDNGEHIVLIDFGISSHADGKTFVMTQPGMTPFYAAPEAIQGIFHRETDYYALGITIFELFTGYTPFQNPGMSGEESAKLAAISKIEFPDDFPENLRKLVLGLTYKDISHRNEMDNPNRRWGYDEVKRWLNGENVPIPGETTGTGLTESTTAPTFQPYRFNGKTYTEEKELLLSMLKQPEEALKDLGRGILSHHYYIIDEEKGKLCSSAEERISKNNTDNRRHLYALIYSLRPDITEIMFNGRMLNGLEEVGKAIIDAVIEEAATTGNLQNKKSDIIDPVKQFALSGIPEDYSSMVLKSTELAKIFENVRKIWSEEQNINSDTELALILGYSICNDRRLPVNGKVYDSPEAFRLEMKHLAGKNRQAYMDFTQNAKEDLQFFEEKHPDTESRTIIAEALADSKWAIFGDNEYIFKSGLDFENFIDKLVREEKPYELQSLFNRYKTPLKDVSKKVWNTDSGTKLEKIVSGFILIGEYLFTGKKACLDFLNGVLERGQKEPAYLLGFIKVHKESLDNVAKSFPEIKEAVSELYASGENVIALNEHLFHGIQEFKAFIDTVLFHGRKDPGYIVEFMRRHNKALQSLENKNGINSIIDPLNKAFAELISFDNKVFSSIEDFNAYIENIIQQGKNNPRFLVNFTKKLRQEITELRNSDSRCQEALNKLMYVRNHVFSFDEYVFPTLTEFRTFIENILQKGQQDPAYLKRFIKVHEKALAILNGVASISTIVKQVMDAGNEVIELDEYTFHDADDFKKFVNGIQGENNEGTLQMANFAKEHHDTLTQIECCSSVATQVKTLLKTENSKENEKAISVNGVKYTPITIKKGYIIKFGNYPQDNNGSKTPIEWLVLDVNGNEAFLISRHTLDCKQYHEGEQITWEDCSLRKWLNSDFLKSAFSEDEASSILVSTVKNDNNSVYSTRGGNDTKDHVFCLSIAEAEQYFSSDEDRECKPTAYARKQGVYVDNGCCYWWLRSPGNAQESATVVCADGSLRLGGNSINYVTGAVRPALKIICDEKQEWWQREELERKQREELERKQREELERLQREEQERKQREEQERKQREEQERLRAQAHAKFSAIIRNGIQKGMIIPFGSYTQDNDCFKTPIEWIVLDVKKTPLLNRVFAKNKLEVLLLSRYALDCIQYNSNQTNLTWEDCDLRKWLNSDFLKSAFSTEEAERILISEIENDDNPKFRTRGGENTKDRIFCLSIAEVKKYFSNDEDRTCKTTAYAREQGAYVNNGYCYWRLRSPGNCQSHASYVYSDGVLNLNGGKVDRVHIAVRPALRVICNL